MPWSNFNLVFRAITRTLSLCLLAGGLLQATSADATEPRSLTLAGVVGSTDAWAGDVILREAYRRLAIKLTIRKLPAERAIRAANAGQLDGEVQRIDAIRRTYKDLLQVTPPINFIQAVAFANSPKGTLSGWQSLRTYDIGIIRGIKFAENGTEGMRRQVVGNYEALFRLLDAGRVDLVVVPRINGLFHQARQGLTEVIELEPALQSLDLFHYLHRKHAALLPRVAQVLTTMKREGRIARIRAVVHAELLRRARTGEMPCPDYSCFEESLEKSRSGLDLTVN